MTEKELDAIRRESDARGQDELQSYYYAAERGEDEPFRIDNDSKADWAVRKIEWARKEHARITALIKEQMAALKAEQAEEDKRLVHNTAWLEGQLAGYASLIPEDAMKKTKIQRTYRLRSGTLKIKHGGVDFPRDDQLIMQWAREIGRADDYIKPTYELRWAELKKHITEVEGGFAFIDPTTGEIEIDPDTQEIKLIPSLQMVQKPDTFIVETEV